MSIHGIPFEQKDWRDKVWRDACREYCKQVKEARIETAKAVAQWVAAIRSEVNR